MHLSAAERKQLVEKKKAEVVGYLHKYYVDPRTKRPHPVARFEAAIAEIKYHVTAEGSVEKQVSDIMKKLPEVLPVKKCEIIAHLTGSYLPIIYSLSLSLWLLSFSLCLSLPRCLPESCSCSGR